MKPPKSLLVTLLALIMAACGPAAPSTAELPTITATSSPVPSATQTPTSTPVPSPTVPPFYLSATVYNGQPQVALLLYHQFKPSVTKSDDRKPRFDDFEKQLDSLNQAGYTLISIYDWLEGRMELPPGRRPLIITLDDLFYNNQIRLDENGIPRADTGLGVAWNYYQNHPEFGFNYVLFASLGDKPYGDGDLEGKWKTELGKTIAWCLDNGALVFSHTYYHIRLDKSTASEIVWDLKLNDKFLRELLTLAEREDLIPRLGNMLAIPYGYWPTGGELTVTQNYTNPEGLPMQALFDVDYIIRPKFLQPIYSPDFDKFRIPRIVANTEAIEYLIQNKELFPAAAECRLGPLDESLAGEAGYLETRIAEAVTSGTCPAGTYVVNGFVFDAQPASVGLILP